MIAIDSDKANLQIVLMKKTLLLSILFTVFSSNILAAAKKPDHLMIMVFDQMRPDYIDRFDLKNFKRLRGMSTDYVNAVTGSLASVTVVSHAVITTGVLPKNLPWGDNGMVDKRGILGEKNKEYDTLVLSQDQLLKGLASLNQNEVLSGILTKKLKRPVFSAGQKHYATIDMGGPSAKSIIYMDDVGNSCIPTGVNVPPYVANDDRFKIDCKQTTAKEEGGFTYEGGEYYYGVDSKKPGGDTWVADVGLSIMKNEDWGAIFLTFGAIDKFGHMIGEPGKESPKAAGLSFKHEDIIRNADAQLGRILDELTNRKLLDRTMIVITSDHGVQSSTELDPEQRKKIAGEIRSSGKIQQAKFDTGVRIWLGDLAKENRDAVFNHLKTVPGTLQILELDRKKMKYKVSFENFKDQPSQVKEWATKHNLVLADSTASESGPDFAVALADGFSLSQPMGDHGGLQERVQRVPMLVYRPGEKSKSDPKMFKHADIKPLVLKAMF